MSLPVLETERLRLRSWREEDFGAYAEFCANEATARLLGGPWKREDAWRRMAALAGHWALRGYGVWALEDKAGRRFVGYSGLWNPEGWPEPEISWGLVAEFQGRGYATEAAGRARTFAYRDLGWSTAVSYIKPENAASRRVAERLGAKLENSIDLTGVAVGVYRHPPAHALNT
jgi:RimJ/RimL family protein N-acetyltransferase